ncbi:hypothetical protein TRFO_15180 [Tritrichomonas foetus]|uniref:Uncharacterized protein n=1 Tax=Tritrichomonas foetus TaxID=1144522 RepID=A0A1J4KXW8_9EUKA|nr:hypothetical protein TRFO_15180 [Tritrichomonas foetus]|eukprot:OHT14405.1 hypothetical protein TRFO_15180 [Tritrichomonas foetus]
MSRTPSAHWVPDTLRRRVPYTDKPFAEQHDPYEISLGLGHREISHLLEIIYDQQATRIDKTKALRLLNDILPGREAEAIQLHAFDALRPLLLQQNNGLLLHTLIALNTLISTMYDAEQLSSDIPRIVDVVHPDNEIPLRIAAAALLRHIAELLGPIDPFIEGDVPIKLVVAAASKYSTPPLLAELFHLLSRLTNMQKVRVPLIENQDLLQVIVKSIPNPDLQMITINLAENIAMDSGHNGKLALLNVDILDELGPLLNSPKISVRIATIALITLLAVPKEGKERIAMERTIADTLKKISESDADLECRRAAYKCRVIVAELPFGKVIVGDVVDPSKPVRKDEAPPEGEAPPQ